MTGVISKDAFLSDLPRFHYWAGEAQLGGFEPATLHKMEGHIRSLGEPSQLVAYETGAGLSTIWLLLLGVRLHSFFIEEDLGRKIEAYLSTNAPGLKDRWTPHVGASEVLLPLHAMDPSAPAADFALVDGGHGMTTAIVDFVYLNWLLRKGGLLAVDDVALGSARLVHDLSMQDGMYELRQSNGKTAYFEKKTDKKLFGDWGTHKDLLSSISAARGPLPIL
ncbi:class I SAM-dependent methyltransferase [Rhizobium sp.]